MIKRTAVILTVFSFAACAHKPPPAESGRLLDDAELAQYREQKAVHNTAGARSVVTLGKGEVDLSNWKSSAEGAGAECNSADGCPADAGGAEAASAADSGMGDGLGGGGADAAAVSPAADDADYDAGSTVEADDVPLVSADEE
ncbi:MAG: hypothetical protein JXX14_19480 [Deltaproteobacteria bacterium]|nr:hypothetical protein [Deltaproteobacteria bacterium]